MLFITINGFAQNLPKLNGHKLIGKTDTTVFTLDTKSIIRTNNNVSFTILGAYYKLSPDNNDPTVFMDINNYVIFSYVGNCQSFEFMHVRSRGVRAGIPFEFKETMILEKANINHPMYEIINDVCNIALVRQLIA